MYTAPNLIIIFKYENIKLKKKKEYAAEPVHVQYLNYRIKSQKGHQILMRLSL
jgi:hypothetical protein